MPQPWGVSIFPVITRGRWWWARGWLESWSTRSTLDFTLALQGRPPGGVFAFTLPATFYLCYFLALMVTEGIAWSVHLWVGSIVLAGIAGWLLSYLLVPPRSSEDRR